MNKSNLFISHCSSDEEILDVIDAQRPVLEKYFSLFYSYKDSISGGNRIREKLKKALRSSYFFIAIITDSYLRSLACVQEISAFWGKGRKIIPIVYNGKAGIDFYKELTGGRDDVIIDVSAMKNDRSPLIKALKDIGVSQEDSESLANNWIKPKQANPDKLKDPRPFIASEDKYYSILQYCLRSGIKTIKSTSLGGDVLRNNLLNKDEIFLIGTTLKGLISGNADMLAEALSQGINVTVLIADKNSSYSEDVAFIESFDEDDDLISWGKKSALEKLRLANEFDNVRINLVSIRNNAKKKAAKRNTSLGRLYLGSTFTLMRQTITMGISRKKNLLWAWVSVTTPPKRASDGTMSFEIEAPLDDMEETISLSETLAYHVRGICEIAKQRNSLAEIDDDYLESVLLKDKADSSFNVPKWTKSAVKQMWSDYYEAAVTNMKTHEGCGDKVLIEIAAQHPLIDGEKPGPAFELRLDEGIRLYRQLKEKGCSCKIYIPGSLHNGDHISLSHAGIEYIKNTNKVDPEDILEETADHSIKGDDGVYNSADECYVASQLFLHGDYRDLWCVCSANQMMRKKLFYIRFGVIPMVRTVPDDAFHSDIDEIFDSIPSLLYEDNNWQDPFSDHALRTRKERMPDFDKWLEGKYS